MSTDNPLPLNELQHSLKSVQQLRRSTLTSVLLMSLGVASILGAFLYSVTRLRPLERQINEKQQRLKDLEEKRTTLERETKEAEAKLANALKAFEEISQRKAETEHILENAKEELKDLAKKAQSESARTSAQAAVERISNARKNATDTDDKFRITGNQGEVINIEVTAIGTGSFFTAALGGQTLKGNPLTFTLNKGQGMSMYLLMEFIFLDKNPDARYEVLVRQADGRTHKYLVRQTDVNREFVIKFDIV
jgi:myosin heavy subunit